MDVFLMELTFPLGTYDELLRMLITGLLFASAVIPGYWLVARILEPQVKQLEKQLETRDGLRTDRADQ